MQRLTLREKFPLNIKGIVYKNCVRSAMFHGSESWCLDQNDMGILQRTERAMLIRICGVKLMDKKSTIYLMQMLDLNEAIDQLVKGNSVSLNGFVLRKDENNFLRRALDFKVNGTKKRGRQNWLIAVVEQSRKDELNVCDANNRRRWRLGVNNISSKMRQIWPTLIFVDKT